MISLAGKIREFLIFSAKNGYGNAQAKTTDEADGSHTIEVTNGDLKLHDNYFGGEPYGGREVIFKDNKPVWMMVYYGSIKDTKAVTVKDIYGFLRTNLLNPDPKMPIRGPLKYSDGKWSYSASITGNLEDFKCQEVIKYNHKLVYQASFTGGLIDKQSD